MRHISLAFRFPRCWVTSATDTNHTNLTRVLSSTSQPQSPSSIRLVVVVSGAIVEDKRIAVYYKCLSRLVLTPVSSKALGRLNVGFLSSLL